MEGLHSKEQPKIGKLYFVKKVVIIHHGKEQ